MSNRKLYYTFGLIALVALSAYVARAQSTCPPEQRKEITLSALTADGAVIENLRAEHLSLKIGGAPATISDVVFHADYPLDPRGSNRCQRFSGKGASSRIHITVGHVGIAMTELFGPKNDKRQRVVLLFTDGLSPGIPAIRKRSLKLRHLRDRLLRRRDERSSEASARSRRS